MTSDLGFDFDEVEKVREQCMLFPLFAEVTAILHCQKKGGHCVLKIFDVFTKMTAKIVCVLAGFYREAFLTKPYTSRSGNPEKYIVCKNFRGITKKQLSDVVKAFHAWNDIETFVGAQFLQNTAFVTDLPGITLGQDVVDAVFDFNHTNIAQRQVRTLASTIRLLRGGQSQGPSDVDRDMAKTLQTRSAKAWYTRYMPPASSPYDVDISTSSDGGDIDAASVDVDRLPLDADYDTAIDSEVDRNEDDGGERAGGLT